MDGAKNSRNRLVEQINELKKIVYDKEKKHKTLQDKYIQQFILQINDDLNTAKALATLWEVVKDKILSMSEKYAVVLRFDDVLGLDLNAVHEENIPEEVVQLAEERELARKKKDWEKSDSLREDIKKLSYSINDVKEGYVLKKIK